MRTRYFVALGALLCVMSPSARAVDISPAFGVTVPLGHFSKTANFSYHLGVQSLQPVGDRFEFGAGVNWHIFTLDPVRNANQSFSAVELSLLTRTRLVEWKGSETFFTLGGGVYSGRSWAGLDSRAKGNFAGRYVEKRESDMDPGIHVGLGTSFAHGEDTHWQFALNYRQIMDNDSRMNNGLPWLMDPDTEEISLSHFWRSVGMVTGTFSLFF